MFRVRQLLHVERDVSRETPGMIPLGSPSHHSGLDLQPRAYSSFATGRSGRVTLPHTTPEVPLGVRKHTRKDSSMGP